VVVAGFGLPLVLSSSVLVDPVVVYLPVALKP
jgi:hypothetical protein